MTFFDLDAEGLADQTAYAATGDVVLGFDLYICRAVFDSDRASRLIIAVCQIIINLADQTAHEFFTDNHTGDAAILHKGVLLVFQYRIADQTAGCVSVALEIYRC